MEDFLNRWAETRLEREPDWDADKELEQGLVSFQTLLEFHTDIAFDFFEAWSLRNIFAVPADLPLVAPHHAGLDFTQPQKKRPSCSRRSTSYGAKSMKQKELRLLLTKAKRTSGHHVKKAQVRLDRLTFLQPDQFRMLHALATDVGAFHASICTLLPLDPANTQSLLPGPGKQGWEVCRAGYISWVNAQLLRHANTATGFTLESASG
ncbi:hypothetical protein EDB89DRAFT_2232842 [Lactarius sanguifluus]|nr:hypothetical protein EDB89DRAFT_2232842 [Lactarius sanguifluus]